MDDLLSIAVSNAVAATVLAGAAIAVGAVYRRPALVHGLWLLVLLKLVTPPLVYIPVAWPTTAEAPAEVAAVGEEPTLMVLPVAEEGAAPAAVAPVGDEGVSGVEVLSSAEETAQPSSVAAAEAPLWPQMLRIVWGVGALAWFLLMLERLHHFGRLLRFARPAPAALQERTRRLARSLGLKSCPRVRLLPGRIAPMLWAVGGSPHLLVPADLLGVLSEEQLDTLLVHELAHLRRRDHWVRMLEFVVMGLYWWHPVVWYARRELREAEEQCCDAWVVSTLPDTGRTYASALLDTLDFLSTVQVAVPPLASGLGQIADLKRRLTMIMQGNTPRSLTWPGCLAVVALGLAILPMLPSLHGEPPREEEAQKSVEEAEKAIQQARAQLELQTAILAKKQAELAQARQQAVSKPVEERVQIQNGKPLIRLVQEQPEVVIIEGGKKATYRIEIMLSADENLDPNEIAEKVRKALPEKLRRKVVLHPAPAYRIQGVRAGAAVPGTTATPQPSIQFVPRNPPAATYQLAPAPAASEKRINDLEEKLEKVLRELQDLRKQMKPQRRPAAPAPAAENYAPPALGLPVAPATAAPPAPPRPPTPLSALPVPPAPPVAPGQP